MLLKKDMALKSSEVGTGASVAAMAAESCKHDATGQHASRGK
jgi:hypothetical protein